LLELEYFWTTILVDDDCVHNSPPSWKTSLKEQLDVESRDWSHSSLFD